MRERELRKNAERELKDTKTLEIELQKVKQDKSEEMAAMREKLSQLESVSHNYLMPKI